MSRLRGGSGQHSWSHPPCPEQGQRLHPQHGVLDMWMAPELFVSFLFGDELLSLPVDECLTSTTA